MSRNVAFSFSFFGFYPPKSCPSPASASELDRCPHGCVRPPEKCGMRGPSSKVTLQAALPVPFKDLSHTTGWGQAALSTQEVERYSPWTIS